MPTPGSLDPLTRLPRRSNFLLALQLASEEARNDRWTLGLVLVQVDRLDGFQAQSTHRQVLPTVSKVIRLACGSGNLVGHLEDSLFAIMKLDTSCEQTHATAERCRFAVEHRFADRARPLTVSVGAVSSPMFLAWSSGHLMALAAWRMGQSRAAGGNAVCGAGFDPRLRQRFANWPAHRTL